MINNSSPLEASRLQPAWAWALLPGLLPPGVFREPGLYPRPEWAGKTQGRGRNRAAPGEELAPTAGLRGPRGHSLFPQRLWKALSTPGPEVERRAGAGRTQCSTRAGQEGDIKVLLGCLSLQFRQQKGVPGIPEQVPGLAQEQDRVKGEGTAAGRLLSPVGNPSYFI